MNACQVCLHGLICKARSQRWLLLALALVLLQAIPNISYPIGRDQATYCVIGQGLLHGKRLYRDLWDNKPPGIFYIYAGIVKIFGSAMWSVGLLDILWLLGISICIFRFAERLLGRPVVFLAVLVNCAMHIRAGYWDAGQPEIFLMLLMFGSYFLLASRSKRLRLKEAAAGLLFAAAFWVKYNAVAFWPFLLFVPYLQFENSEGTLWQIRLAIEWPTWLSKMSRFTAGFLLASTVLVSGLLFSGSWAGFVEEQFEVLPRYAAAALTGVQHYWTWAAGRVGFWLGISTMVVAFAAILLAWRRHQLSRLAPTLIGAVSGFAALTVQIRYQPYYFETCYPFFAIFWGYVGVQAWESAQRLARYFRERNWYVAGTLAWVVFANLVMLCLPGSVLRLVTNYKAFSHWLQDPVKFYSDYSWPGAAEDFRHVLQVVDYLKHNPTPTNGVYVWGNEPLIYYLSGHQPPARFVWNLPLIASWRLPGWRRQLVRQLSESHPHFIIVSRNDEVHDLSGSYQDSAHKLQTFPALRNYLRIFYHPCKNDVSFEIYCRKPAIAAVSSAGPPA